MKESNNYSDNVTLLRDKRTDEIVRLIFSSSAFARIKNAKGVEIVISKSSLLLNFEEL
jgi:hypothetical protein